MKTFLALLLLIPSLSWSSEIKYLLCATLDEKTNQLGLKSVGVILNTNTKMFTSYHILESGGDYRVKKSVVTSYSQTADYIKLETVVIESGNNRWTINRKDLEWRKDHSNPALALYVGQCHIYSSEQSVIKKLNGILKDNLDQNLI